ncbi:MAG: tryptophan--tRNA ligase [Gammaproteobacteria bacterium]|nr:tryptophan--tRNA ligase [Gammaproteobacteria bacterium]MYD81637.1 tryptophan--tRNA ligase [Gammaproteobacteria bacterium]
MTDKRLRSFSGIQPSGKIHIGNYTGALKPWVDAQDEVDGIYCVVDLHALTASDREPRKSVGEQSREVAALYLACGLDPKASTIFLQSEVWTHPYLSWVFETQVPLGWLTRMTQFKSKANETDSVPTALLTYPVLQAADILLYDAEIVPVGEDQKQHIEIARDIAQRFNSTYGSAFVLPEPKIGVHGSRIMALDEPTVKMSKSRALVNRGHSIGITDDPDAISRTIRRAVTDSGTSVDVQNAGAGIRNLLNIYRSFSGESDQEASARFDGKGYGVLKNELAELLVDALAPIRSEYQRLLAERLYLNDVLNEGQERAFRLSTEKVACVLEILGLRG